MRSYLKEINGWIKLHRRELNNSIVMKTKNTFCVWMQLMLLCTYKKRKAFFNGEKIWLKEGEIITSRDELAEMLRGLNSSSVECALTLFEKQNLIEQKKTRGGRLITLKNWKKYQNIETNVQPEA